MCCWFDNAVSTADIMCGRVRRNWKESVVAYFNILEGDTFKIHRQIFCFILILVVRLGTKHGNFEHLGSAVTINVKLRMS